MQRRFKGASVDATEAGGEVASTEAGEGPERWTSGRKADVVLRLLRGEDVATVSREIGVPELIVPARIVRVPEVPLLGTGKTDYVAIQRMAESEARAA